MNPTIKTLSEKKLVGKRLQMSLANNKTVDLWKSFMPRRREIRNNVNTDLYDVRIYDESYDFKDFNPGASFEKWAAIEVRDFDIIPDAMEALVIDAGLYAVFHYKGLSSDPKVFKDIYGTWLPNSEYVLDQRPHFEIMGKKYKNNDPDSEEDIWIPIKPKAGK